MGTLIVLRKYTGSEIKLIFTNHLHLKMKVVTGHPLMMPKMLHVTRFAVG